MKEELLKQLVEKTFNKLACPLQGNGVYAEIQQAVMAAYNMGKRQADFIPGDMILASNFIDD
ncbi:MAG: hypothetical protein EOP51_04230 [Sphingobacteriales bacterium]|nr:MAG: hypothetical protein EOP51_04230 [Sphingobacteriales bacterium]